MSWEAPCPEEIQAHLSPFSLPELSVQPPAGNVSVIVSAYSWPSTIETPSRVPAEPELTKFSPQLAPASVTYGRLVKAMSGLPGGGETASDESPVKSCHAQKLDVAKPSGEVPVGDTITYCELEL